VFIITEIIGVLISANKIEMYNIIVYQDSKDENKEKCE
jgi:hypothetical protein